MNISGGQILCLLLVDQADFHIVELGIPEFLAQSAEGMLEFVLQMLWI